MEEKRTSLILISLAVVSIIIIASLIIIILDSSELDVITALEGRDIAEPIALSWHDDAVLEHIVMTDKNINGKSNSWRYRFYSPSSANTTNNYTQYDVLSVSTYSNGTLDSYTSITGIIQGNITNWTIDSDEAYEIAKNNRMIANWLSKYQPSFRIDLWGDGIYGSNSVWDFYFDDMSLASVFENYHRAEIHIDAHTGEVLFVDDDA